MSKLNVSTQQRPLAQAPGKAPPPTTVKSLHKWIVDSQGRITNFDLKALRNDILYRIQGGHNLYTVEECRVFIIELTRVATKWQETELAQLQYLADLHSRVLPGRQVVYQWPPPVMQNIPHAAQSDQMQDNPLYKITQVVDELNRSLVRMIDQIWYDRRERMLLSARILRDLEAAVGTE